MRNINELIGIIKGINFDGHVNEKEVLFLQSWLNKNRNLIYDKKQSELINMLDAVLKDQVLEGDERTELLQRAEEFLLESGDKTAKIYEFNKIIEGIICDGELNVSEAYYLKKWMEENSNLINEHKLTESFGVTIDNILKDGSITKKEQQHLYELITERVKNLQFETKLNYLSRQVKARENIGPDLIDILDNESVISEIHKRAEGEILDALMSYSGFCSNKEIVVISLVLIAMLEYDGNYYDSVRSTYKKVYDRYSEQKVEGFIRSLLSKYKKKDHSSIRTRIINVALENAIVPQKYLSAFFEFIFDIYEKNFEYDLPQNPRDDFLFVFEGLRSNMLSKGENIRLDVTQKTYKLIETTKQLIAREDDRDAVVNFSILILNFIDKRFWGKDVKIFNPYLKTGYEGWEKQFKESMQGRHLQRKTVSEFRSRWEPKFNMDNNSIYLNPPVHRVKAQYDYRNLVIVVLNDGIEIYRDKAHDIREIIGGYQINSQKIMVNNPLGKLTYRLVAEDQVIYDSNEKLYRNYIVFDENGQEIINNTDFEGNAFICYRNGESELQNMVSKENYCIGNKLVETGDAIRIGNDVFNFSSMVKPGIFGQLHNDCFVRQCGSDDYIPVYKEVRVIAFEAENSSNKFEININGKPYKLSELVHKTTVRDTIIKYVVSLELTDYGIYSIEVNQLVKGKKNRILRKQFAYDCDLEFKLEPLNDFAYKLQVASSLLSEKVVSEITTDEFNFDIIRFESKGKEYNYMLPFDTGFYKIDDQKWNTIKNEIWIGDISADSTLKLYDSKCDGMILYSQNGTVVEDNVEVKNRGFYKVIPIGFLKSYKMSNKHVVLAFTVDGKVKHKVVCYNKCEIDSEATEIVFSDEPKKIMVTPVFHGKNKVFFEMFNKQGQREYISKELVSGETVTLKGFNSFEKYKFEFHEKTESFLRRNKTLLFFKEKIFYAREDYVGKVFKIKTVYYDQFKRGKQTEKSYDFNTTFVRFTEFKGSDVFGGEIFVKNTYREWNLEKVNPVEIELCSEIIDDTMDVYITNEGDGLLMDFKNRGILNTTEDHTASMIFSYTISMRGED